MVSRNSIQIWRESCTLQECYSFQIIKYPVVLIPLHRDVALQLVYFKVLQISITKVARDQRVETKERKGKESRIKRWRNTITPRFIDVIFGPADVVVAEKFDAKFTALKLGGLPP